MHHPKGHIFPQGRHKKLIIRFLKDHTRPTRGSLGTIPHRAPLNQYIPQRRFHTTGDEFQEGGFSRTIGPGNTHPLPWGYRKTNILKGRYLLIIGMVQMVYA
jgi:hypothetical protein